MRVRRGGIHHIRADGIVAWSLGNQTWTLWMFYMRGKRAAQSGLPTTTETRADASQCLYLVWFPSPKHVMLEAVPEYRDHTQIVWYLWRPQLVPSAQRAEKLNDRLQYIDQLNYYTIYGAYVLFMFFRGPAQTPE